MVIICFRHFSDLSDITLGDGKADILCIAPDGSVTGALNKGLNNFQDIGLIRSAQGIERANIRFADLNGDVRNCSYSVFRRGTNFIL